MSFIGLAPGALAKTQVADSPSRLKCTLGQLQDLPSAARCLALLLRWLIEEAGVVVKL